MSCFCLFLTMKENPLSHFSAQPECVRTPTLYFLGAENTRRQISLFYSDVILVGMKNGCPHVHVLTHAEVSCFDNVALLYHPF